MFSNLYPSKGGGASRDVRYGMYIRSWIRIRRVLPGSFCSFCLGMGWGRIPTRLEGDL